jgi:hypothetical protein
MSINLNINLKIILKRYIYKKALIKKTDFSTYFDPKHLENISDNLINSFIPSKKQKKNTTKPEIKKFTELVYVFLENFKVKKTPNVNSSH